VQVGGNVNTLMQQVMAMRSPELMARMPEVEAMPWDKRVALVSRGHYNITQLIRGWDKFGDLLMAQGWTRQEVKQKAKALKNARSRLEMGMRLADPKKIPKAFEDKAHSAFDVLAAWFLMDAGSLENVLTGPRIEKGTVSTIQATLPAPSTLSQAAPAELPSGVDENGDEKMDEVVEAGMVDVAMDVSNDASGHSDDDVRDVARDDYRD
jgi:hypothetical protein